MPSQIAFPRPSRGFLASALAIVVLMSSALGEEPVPAKVKPWLAGQDWKRTSDGPALALNAAKGFDDTHLLAPCVARTDEGYLMWYCGSTGTVAGRAYHLGLARSRDGSRFERHAGNPVLSMKDGKHSILTPTVLRHTDGSLLREQGEIRMWFSSTNFSDKSGLHTLHESRSKDGIEWSEPSPALLEHVYAPTVVKEGDRYRMWYTDVSREPWRIRHAESRDGRAWKIRDEPVLRIDQEWEKGRLFYPAVVKHDGLYLMWYGSYWSAQRNRTALGIAVSLDGLRWHKSPDNPVFRPDPERAWESHYTTSQTVMRLPDGTWRIWYASRKQPPFVNKYFAISTASWRGPR